MTTYRGNPSLGARVLSADGEEIGTIEAIAGTCFKVLPDEEPDFWLGADTIDRTSGAGVRLNRSKSSMGRYDSESPHHGYHQHN